MYDRASVIATSVELITRTTTTSSERHQQIADLIRDELADEQRMMIVDLGLPDA